MRTLSESSLASTLDPLAKACWLLAVSIVGAILSSPLALLVSLIWILSSFALCSRDEIGRARRYIWIILFVPSLLLFFHAVFLPFTSDLKNGAPAVTFDATVYSLRILTSLLALVFLLITTDVRQLVDRFTDIGVPAPLAFAVFLMLRFAELFRNDAFHVHGSMLLRAGGKRCSIAYIRLMCRRYVPTLVLLGMVRADQSAMAMDLRGHDLRTHRTSLLENKWPAVSWVLPVSYVFVMSAWPFVRDLT